MSAAQPRLQDPRSKHPRPDFSDQKQSIPGDEKDMHPAADHGEKSYRGNERLKGQVALITGGDSGIGRAIALAYAREGADILFTWLDETDDAEITKKLIEAEGRKAVSVQMDQTSRQACDESVARCVKELGRIDVLINNAAFQKTYATLQDISDEDIALTFKTNIEAFFYFCRAALPHIPAGGSIINTTSIQAFAPKRFLLPYAATKAAIANFTIALAQEAIDQGVRVNAVAPGPVWTPLIPSTMPADKVATFGENTLFGRPAQPSELAPLYVFLASEDASYISGEIYGITGGNKQL